MGISPQNLQVIRASLPAVAGAIGEVTPLFYRSMFAAHPELLSDLFNRGNQKQGAQQKALAASVATFAAQLVDPSAPDPVMMLDRIAHKHVSLGITPDQYQIVHDNLHVPRDRPVPPLGMAPAAARGIIRPCTASLPAERIMQP